MSKVVHLPNEAHAKAKAYCEPRKLMMSEWVAGLIDAGIEKHREVEAAAFLAPPQRAGVRPGLVPVPRRRLLDETPPKSDEDLAVLYEAPPFWHANTNRRR